MLSSNGNPYLRPEYLNPPPATSNTMDSKKSPLALLAQTCSQIGADPGVKTSPSSATNVERKKTTSENSKNSPVLSVHDGGDQSGQSKNKKTAINNNRLTPTDRRSKSTSPKNPNVVRSSSGGVNNSTDSTTTMQQHPAASSSSSSSHHHLMMAAALAGQASTDSSSSSLVNSYKSLMAAAGMVGGPYGGPFPPYSSAPAGYAPPHPIDAYASALNAVKSSSSAGQQAAPFPSMMSGYMASHPAAAYSAALQQAMQQYGRPTKLNESTCRDPYCTGCPASNNNAAAAAAAQIHMVCTAGCALSVQCDHLKVPIAGQQLGPSSSPNSSPNPRPYVCNWIVGDNYCGKRFVSSDDLLQHLRTHTNVSAEAAAFSPFAHHPSMRAAYPTPPLSPLSAARYHPYGKSSATTTTSQSTPFPSPFHHPGMAAAMAAMGPYGPPPPASLFQHFNPALAPYYSHLSLFGNSNQQSSGPSRQQQQQQQQGVVLPSSGLGPPAGGPP